MTDFKKIASQIQQDIDNYSLSAYRDDRREHLGASEIGEECLRRLWYLFRWCKSKSFPPRMYRLFRRGHKAESNFVELLRGIGFNIWEVDPNTGKQYVFSELGGHYGGSTDGIASYPFVFRDYFLICEFKTHNDKSFKMLRKAGVRISKPKHYAQMSNYGAKFNCSIGLYCAVNKNDDDIHIEIVELDWNVASEMSEKARYIITAPVPPPRITNASPSFYKCQECESLHVCHYRSPPDKNCRSCEFATPVDGPEWYCRKWNGNIPKDIIPTGCPEYKAIV
jgi:hypothetical protein